MGDCICRPLVSPSVVAWVSVTASCLAVSLRSRRILIKVILGGFCGRLWNKDVIQHLQTTFLLLKFDPLLFPSVGIWPNLGYFNKYAKKRKLLFELQVLFRFPRSCLHFFLLPNHCFLCVKDLNVKKGNRSL